MPEWTKNDYERLGDEVRSGRFAKHMKRDDFAALVGISTRTLSDIENGDLGGRKSFSRETLTAIEKALDWWPGATRAILNGHSVAGGLGRAYGDQIREHAAAGGFSGEGTLTVGGTPQDSGEEGAGPFLYKRPEGLTDEQWREIELRGRAYLDGLIEGASHER